MAGSWVSYGRSTLGQGFDRLKETWDRADGRAILDRAAASARNVLAIASLESLREDQRALSVTEASSGSTSDTATGLAAEAGRTEACTHEDRVAEAGAEVEGGEGVASAVEREAEEVATRQRIPDMYVRLGAGRSREAVARERTTTVCAVFVGLVLFWWVFDLWFVTHE